MITLFSNEKIITISEGEQVTVTNYRVNYTFKTWGHSSYESIFLENISLVRTFYKSRPIFLYLAGLALLLAIITWYNDEPGFTNANVDNVLALSLIGSAIIFVIIWSITRPRIITLYSDSGQRIELNVPQWSSEEAISFLDIVQLTKAQRVFELYSADSTAVQTFDPKSASLEPTINAESGEWAS